MVPACGRQAEALCGGEESRTKTTQRLYRCQNALCHVAWIDRDANAARNIAQVGYAVVRTQTRPEEFTKAFRMKQPGYKGKRAKATLEGERVNVSVPAADAATQSC
jgi:hypothetical protein